MCLKRFLVLRDRFGILATLFCAVAGLLWSSPALAAHRHVFAGSFEGGEGPFAEPDGVAVNDSTGDVYVVDRGNDRVEQFDAGGTFLASFNGAAAPTGAFSSPTGVAVDNSSDPLDPSAGDLYVIDAGHEAIDKFDAAGSYIGQLTEGAPGSPLGPLEGVAVDANGQVWVYREDREIDSFSDSLSNEFLSSRSSPFGTSPGFAVDSEDNLYVLRGEPFVGKLNSAGEELIEAIDEEAASAVGVDLSDNQVYIDNFESIGVFETTSSTSSLLERFGTGHLSAGSGLAINPTTGTVYVADSAANVVNIFASVVIPDVTTGGSSGVGEEAATVTGEVNPDGEPITSCEFEYGTSASYGEVAPCSPTPGAGTAPVQVSADLTALEPRTVYHYRLVATNANGSTQGADRTFTTTAHVSIDGESVTEVTSSSAILNAEINPGALPTSYRFEYGPTTSYGTSLPTSGGNTGAGILDVLMRAHAQDLEPSTSYHYRVVASNALGEVVGEDHQFTTQPPGAGPLALPDGRSYELVSPPDKNGGAVSTDRTDQVSTWESSPAGDEMIYSAPPPFAGAQTGAATGSYYLARREPGGWSTQSLLPPQAPGCNICQPQIEMFSTDLSKAILLDGGGEGLGQDDPQLVPGEPLDSPNLFIRDNSTGSYQLIDLTPADTNPAQPNLAGGSDNLTHVVFNERAQLTENTPAGEGLYDWMDGSLYLVSPAIHAALGDGVNRMHAISADGSRIFFTANGNLYLREDHVRTVQVDSPQGPGSGGGGQFMTASSDGSEVFFTDDASAGLTEDTAPASGANLYEFDVASGVLTDLTSASAAEVQGVLGASEDSAYVYFVANGALASGAQQGEPNLYVQHAGVTTFIATLELNDAADWEASDQVNRTARVTPDGRHIAFESGRSLTGYDNVVSGGGSCGEGLGERCTEVFEYGADSNELLCASCNAPGVPPLGPSLIGHHVETNFQAEGYLSRNLSDDGSRLFFNSLDALLPTATNGKENVYEHELDGAGSCDRTSGCLYLISTGESRDDSLFEDASASGNDIFFTTDDELVKRDTDAARDLYDARVGGGFAESPAGVPCAGETCRATTASAPPPPSAGSVSFVGPGNVGPSGQGTLGKLTLAGKMVRDSTITLRVVVPGSGRISASGRGVCAVTRRINEAGTYTLRLHLTNRERRRLEHRRRLHLKVRLAYVPTTGTTSIVSVHLTAKAQGKR